LLASFEPERIAFARRLIESTDRAFTLVTSPGDIARFVRLNIVPLVLPRIFGLDYTRRYMLRPVSQLGINYRQSPISRRHPHRLPPKRARPPPLGATNPNRTPRPRQLPTLRRSQLASPHLRSPRPRDRSILRRPQPPAPHLPLDLRRRCHPPPRKRPLPHPPRR